MPASGVVRFLRGSLSLLRSLGTVSHAHLRARFHAEEGREDLLRNKFVDERRRRPTSDVRRSCMLLNSSLRAPALKYDLFFSRFVFLFSTSDCAGLIHAGSGAETHDW